ncbi:hypothetical protein CTKZ_20470 [Cellulomonas algicola]|uniref:Peptidase S8/S53 domain-containing protein n=1 Tax=Cellulomonas algicola TaxID=2071633 RepID=A0A401V0Q2_9CELL|nr:S8 family serine peptidase [Cellulomonas algicola]GCD20485.1 hypothetical protein CTKZ_20470 [Cellulomonas algicola]
MLKSRPAVAALTLALTAVALTPLAAWSAPAPVSDPTTGPVLHARDDLPAYEPPPATDVQPDQVLVRFAPGASRSTQSSTLSAAGAATTGELVPGTRFVAVPVGDEDAEEVAARLAQDPDVAEVQVDHVRHAFGWTNDPLLSYTWPYLDLTRQPRAWEATRGQGVVIAVLDSGVAGAHEDLAGRVLTGRDFVDASGANTDPNGHGTMVAGTAAAIGNNGKGTVGVAYGATILPVRVLDAAGNSTDSRVASGIAYAVQEGADVINLSLGGPGTSQVLFDAIDAAVNAGVVVVAAAGNEGDQVRQYPAAYAPQIKGLLSVSGTDYAGALAGWSTWGDTVSIAAPGHDVVGPRAQGGYSIGSGTSFAAPAVSGAAALVLAREPALSPDLVEQRLVSTARDAGPRGYDPYYGAGVLDVAAAVTAVVTQPSDQRAAAGVALDRAPADPGSSDDTPVTARALSSGSTATATLSPEGDVDWYSVALPAAGTYRAHVGQTSEGDPAAGPLLDLVVEVQDTSGAVLGRADDGDETEPEDVFVQVAAATTVLVGVSNANGSAPADRTYELRVEQGPTAPFTPSFTPPADPARTDVGVLAAGDVTGDGKDDAVTVEPRGGVYVYPGKGDGTLATPVNVPVPGIVIDGHGVAVADFTGDGKNDAVATTSTGFVLLTQAAGSLGVAGQTPVTFGGAAFGGFDIAAVKWDADSFVDVVVSTSRPSIQVFRGNGSGVFTPVAEALTTQSAQYLAVGDVTGDGRPDVVTTHAVHPQAADGTLAAPVAMPSAGGPLVTAVAVGDVTGDGRADVVRLNGSAVRVDAALAGGGFAATKEYPAGGESGGDLVIGQIDADTRNDVLVSNAFDMRVSLLRQNSDGTLSAPMPSPIEQTVYDRPGQLALAKLDGDARVDAVLAEGGVIALQQTVPSGSTSRGWLRSTSIAPHASGVAVQPTIRLGFARDLATVTKATVRLLDGTGATVGTAAPVWDGATRTVSLTPDKNLAAGQHYSVVVSGVTDGVSNATLPAPIRIPFTVAAGGDRYTPVEPFRVVDTRDPATPGTYGAVRSGQRLVVSLAGLLPPDATAVVMSITATRHDSLGNVRAFPTAADGSGPTPNSANLNVVPGVDQPNLTTVQLGAGQTLAVMPEGPTTHLILDVFGYYSPGGASGYVPVTPRRVLDTRNGTGVPAGAVTGGRWVDLQVSGTGGVPADATAVVLNVAGTNVQGATFVSVLPTPDLGEPWSGPSTSNLNLYPGRDQANLVTVKVGENGRVRFWVNQSATHLVADLAGYYTATGTNGLVPVAPTRVADSRVPLGFSGILRAGRSMDVKIGGTSAVPSQATAAVVNLAGVQPPGLTHVRVFPTTVPASLPEVASINLVPGRDESNMAILTLGVDGKSTFYAQSSDVHMVVDVFGWFRTYR